MQGTLSEALLAGCRINREFCDLLESGAKPTVAAIQGMALGGGLEVAMACNGRVSAPGQPPDSTNWGGCLPCGTLAGLCGQCSARKDVYGCMLQSLACDQQGCRVRSHTVPCSLGKMLHVARDAFSRALLGAGN